MHASTMLRGFDRLRARGARVSREISSAQLAKQVGVAHDTICNWENGTSAPTARRVPPLAVALALRPRSLTTLSDEELHLSDLRILQGLDIEDMAARIGRSALFVRALEQGSLRLSRRSIQELAAAYGVGREQFSVLRDRASTRPLLQPVRPAPLHPFDSELARSRRKELGLTQTELALEVGVVRTAVSGWESGRTHPSAHQLPALATSLGCTVEELLGEWDEPRRRPEVP